MGQPTQLSLAEHKYLVVNSQLSVDSQQNVEYSWNFFSWKWFSFIIIQILSRGLYLSSLIFPESPATHSSSFICGFGVGVSHPTFQHGHWQSESRRGKKHLNSYARRLSIFCVLGVCFDVLMPASLDNSRYKFFREDRLFHEKIFHNMKFMTYTYVLCVQKVLYIPKFSSPRCC